MKKIDFLGTKFDVESWWKWVCVDENGEVSLFYQEPTFEYWNGYLDGRFWDVDGASLEWKCLGFIENSSNACLINIE